MSVKEKQQKGARAHAQPMKNHSEPARERGHRKPEESNDDEPTNHRHRFTPPEDEAEEQPRSKRRHAEEPEQVAVPRVESEPAAAADTDVEPDEDAIEPSAEELQAEEATVQAVAGMVPRDEDINAPVKERGGYDADTAIKLYLREI